MDNIKNNNNKNKLGLRKRYLHDVHGFQKRDVRNLKAFLFG